MRGSGRLWFFVFGWLGMMLYFMQRWQLGPLIPTMMADFGVGKSTLGAVGSASMWGYMLTPVFSGILSDRFGRRAVILTGIVGFSTLSIVSGLVVSTGQLMAVRFLTGITEAFFFVPLIAYTLELFPERPGFYLTLMSSGSSLGWFTGPALAGWLLNLSGSWRVPFVTTGLLGLAVALLIAASWPGEKRPSSAWTFPRGTVFQPGNLAMILLLSVVVALQISAEFGFTLWLPALLELEAGASASIAGLVAGAYGVGQFFGRPLLGWVSDRFSYRPVGIAGAVILGISLLLVIEQNALLPRFVFTFQAGFIGAAVMGAVWTFTGLFFSSSKGLALGIITMFGYIGGSASPILIGYLADHYSVEVGIRSVCVPAAFMAGLVLLSTFFVKPSLIRSSRDG